MSFQSLQVIEPILKALNTEGYTTPTPIQTQTIPIALQGKDLLGCAQTGTGKTAAFAIPILQKLYEQKSNENGLRKIKALILTPTRELAIQIDESFAVYGKHTGLSHAVILGGVSQYSQVNQLNRGVDILIATPGRLLDLIQQRYITLQYLQFFVLDEADRMLDMGFINDVKKIITKLPIKRQTLFFSATMPAEILHLSQHILRDPIKIEVTPISSTAENITQAVYFVEKEDKRSLLIHLLQNKNIGNALVFTRTKHGADKIAKELNRVNVKTDAIHGNKSQNARQRALTNFKNKNIRILVATDIAARGIDIENLTHVINFDLPNIPETYVHRIGRTGRAGSNGIALSFCDREEKVFLRDIHQLIEQPITVIDEHPFKMIQPSYDEAKRNHKNPLNARPFAQKRSMNQRRWSQ